MKTMDISLLGRSYQVACPTGQEKRVQELARMLEEKMRLAVSASQGAVGEIRLLLLAGLMLADDVIECKAALDRSNIDNKQQSLMEEDVMVAAVDHLAARINTLAARIETT
jgi:cell division protein ZapA